MYKRLMGIAVVLIAIVATLGSLAIVMLASSHMEPAVINCAVVTNDTYHLSTFNETWCAYNVSSSSYYWNQSIWADSLRRE